MMRILIVERIAEEGLAYLKGQPVSITEHYSLDREELLEKIGDYDALIVRSVTQVDEALYRAGTRLRVVGRAGNGTEKNDLEGATARGIIVVNTPDANTVSAAEHTIALLMALCRNIPDANAHIKRGAWDRTPFRGVELFGKTLGIVGLGRIGSLVAKRLKAFDMRVIAYDPYIPESRFEALGVERVDKLMSLVQRSDFLTLHTPKTKETIGLINKSHFSACKPSLRIVNCARGGIVDEADLYEALTEKRVAGAAIDVLKDEPRPISPLLGLQQTVITPHLGADTAEAQINVGQSVAEAVYLALQGQLVTNAVNLPALDAVQLNAHRPYLQLCEMLGSLGHQLLHQPIKRMSIEYRGESQTLQRELLAAALLKGLLEAVIAGQVNYVNAQTLAAQREIGIIEVFGAVTARYPNAISITLDTEGASLTLEGAVSANAEVKITAIDGFSFDLCAEGDLLLIENHDRPGMIGTIGKLVGERGINISHMNVGVKPLHAAAMMLLKLDQPADSALVAQLQRTEGIHRLWPIAI